MTDGNPFYDLLKLSVYLNSEEVQLERIDSPNNRKRRPPFVDFNNPTATGPDKEEETNSACRQRRFTKCRAVSTCGMS
jgi:hypothetical protein